MKALLIFCLFILFTSCNENQCNTQSSNLQKAEAGASAACPQPTPTPTPTPDPDPVPGEVPHEALIFDADYTLTNFERADEEKLEKAIEIIKKVIATNEFRSRVLTYTYEGKKQFVDNKGMSNDQIYQALLDGKEDLKPEVDHQMDLELELYYSWQSTVGYTTPGQMKIFLNTKFFYPFTPSQVAGNVFHEWTHKLGFEHATTYSVSRDSSVPYAIGNLIEELGKKYE